MSNTEIAPAECCDTCGAGGELFGYRGDDQPAIQQAKSAAADEAVFTKKSEKCLQNGEN